MRKPIASLILSLIVLVAFGMEAKAQIPKEGTLSGMNAFSATFKVVAMGQEQAHVTYEVLGVAISDTGEGPFHNSSFRCIGAQHVVKGAYDDDSGFCEYIRPDGDKIFVTYKATGKMGVGGKGTATFVGGTGKMAGIQGSSEFTRFNVRPVAEGTFQGYQRTKGQYKLPWAKGGQLLFYRGCSWLCLVHMIREGSRSVKNKFNI
jgi:hypothetical protein